MNYEEWLKWREEHFRKIRQWEETKQNQKEKKRKVNRHQ